MRLATIAATYAAQPDSRDMQAQLDHVLMGSEPEPESQLASYVSQRHGLGLAVSQRCDTRTTNAATWPLHNGQRSHHLAFTGRIYNHAALRRELLGCGHRFKTQNDAEVVLHGYAQWGLRVVEHLNGAWAFALWDETKKTLFCSRDRLGIATLYHFTAHGCLHLASSIPTLMRWAACPREPNWGKVCDFLTHGENYAEGGSETFFHNVKSLPPASNLVMTPTCTRTYWWWHLDPERTTDVCESTTADLRELLADAVRLRIEANRRPAFAISGGLDSSSALALALPHLASKPAAFSLCYDDELLDERHFIDLVEQFASTRSARIFPTAQQFFTDLPSFLAAHDEPLYSPSGYGHYALMQEVSAAGFSALHFGHGLDEAAAGYPHHYGYHLADLRLRGETATYAQELAHWKSLFWGTDQLYETFFNDHVNPGGTFNPLAHATDTAHCQSILNADGFALCRPAAASPQPYKSLLKNSLLRDLTTNTLPCFLRLERDHCAAFAVESHAPFLDHRVIEALMAMPDCWLIRNGQFKYAIREAMRGVLPEPLRTRTNKVGLNVPQAKWLSQRGLARETIAGTLASQELKEVGIFDAAKLKVPTSPYDPKLRLIWRVLAVVLWHGALCQPARMVARRSNEH